MKKIVFLLLSVAVVATSCVKSSKDYKRLESERDSLVLINEEAKSDFNEMLSTLNEVEEGFAKMKEAENYLLIQANTTEQMATTTREKLTADLELVAETLQKNREKLAKLERLLANSNTNVAAMKKNIERLSSEIETKTATIVTLQERLAQRDIQIQELDDAVVSLGKQVNTLTQESELQSKTIQSQDGEINTVWYVYGTKDELKKHKIVSGGGLFKSADVLKGDFDRSYFIQDDMRKLGEIPLYAEKIKMLSNHPTDSYRIISDENGNKTLVIDNPSQFWNLSKYLVVQVN